MVNTEYKDRLFKHYFGLEENKGFLLSLYNALNDTNYDDLKDLEIYTIDDAIYMKMKNDVSCIIDNYISLYEQQSTINPNMPIRGLMYFAKMYDKYRVQHELNFYSKALQKIPTPSYYVFYNGTNNAPEKTVLKLSDAFMQPIKDGCFEWTATVININKGHNENLIYKCKPLADYCCFVNLVKDNREKHMTLDEAIDNAVDWCIKNNIMANYLAMHRAEVKDMFLTEYDEQETMRLFKAEYLAEGKAEGLAEGITKEQRQAILNMQKAKVPLETICEMYDPKLVHEVLGE